MGVIWATHPFRQRQLNVLDENGNEGCAVCGRPREVHRDQVSVPSPEPVIREYL